MHPVHRVCKRRCQAVHETSFFHTERIAFRLLAMTGVASADVHVLRMALIIAVINAFTRFAVNRDRPARMIQRALITVPSLVAKALAAGVAALLRLASAHHNITLAAIMIGIVGAVHRRTF